MNIHLENVNLQSTSGPNHFGSKLVKYMKKNGVLFHPDEKPDATLCFIESHRKEFNDVPLIQRLDNIYFNIAQNYGQQNENIKRTYNNAHGVIYQSNYSKNLITKWFGAHSNSTIIHNGADIEYIDSIKPIEGPRLDEFENVWCCASSWRPHKRLNENINYFLEHSSEKDCLIVAGEVDASLYSLFYEHRSRVIHVGNLDIEKLMSLYKRADYFIHLAYLDCCPNVVVDARTSGCQIICSSTGGTKEIAGPDAIIIEEEEWDFEPIKLYEPPVMDFNRKVKNKEHVDYNMRVVAQKYKDFLEGTINEKN